MTKILNQNNKLKVSLNFLRRLQGKTRSADRYQKAKGPGGGLWGKINSFQKQTKKEKKEDVHKLVAKVNLRSSGKKCWDGKGSGKMSTFLRKRKWTKKRIRFGGKKTNQVAHEGADVAALGS